VNHYKLQVLQTSKWAGLFQVARFLTSNATRILCYHGVWLGPDEFCGDALFMHRATFEKRLDVIQHLGYEVISLSRAVEALTEGKRVPPNSIVITIDDGWYSAFRYMLPALQKRSLPATLYCDTAHLESEEPVPHVMAEYFLQIRQPEPLSPAARSEYVIACDHKRLSKERLEAVHKLGNHLGIDTSWYIANRVFHYMTRDELVQAVGGGLDVQLHTHNHTLGDLSAAYVRAEVSANRSALGLLLGRSPETFQHFCYPSGIQGGEAVEELARLGILSSTTTTPGLVWPWTSRQLLPRFLDGENVSELEFEAAVSGFMYAIRAAKRMGVSP
jgi:peptidoglycan/xylan/chitin deacetylase (PgdA/CDA1 family)